MVVSNRISKYSLVKTTTKNDQFSIRNVLVGSYMCD